MKTQDLNPNDESLRQLLHEWKVEAPPSPRFKAEVWRRIEHSAAEVPLWMALLSRLNAVMARPTLAASYATVLLLAGLIAGYWQARVANAHADQMLGARYVQMLDPYQNSNP